MRQAFASFLIHFHLKISHSIKTMKTYTVKVYDCGTKAWYLNGKRHREDGPAFESADGDKAWYLNGKRHREDGPACEFVSGTKEWWLSGERHREDGPAVESANGTKEWWLNGKLHREDGPAVEPADGTGTKQWFLNGKSYTKQQWRAELDKRNKTCDGKVVEMDGVKYRLVQI